MICSKCSSVNEHEQITREKDKTTTLMILRCKACGHEYEQAALTTWSDEGEPVYFKVNEWTFPVHKFY